MAKIFYSVLGEGRGHAARARGVIESLRDRHQLTVFGADFAYDFLKPHYVATNVEIHRVQSLTYRYTPSGRINFAASAFSVCSSMHRYLQTILRLQHAIERSEPDLAITDFEPLMARAANRTGLKYVSLDHQHFLAMTEPGLLPWKLRLQTNLMKPFVQHWYSGQVSTIVSSFFPGSLRPPDTSSHSIGVILRPEILNAEPNQASHVVAYFRGTVDTEILNELNEIGCEVRVYGLEHRHRFGRLVFHSISERQFIEDLVTSRALITTAGNQLIGEAIFLGKPILAIPAVGHFEQNIHAHFLKRMGAGEAINMKTLTSEVVRQFLDRSESCPPVAGKHNLVGNQAAASILESILCRQA